MYNLLQTFILDLDFYKSYRVQFSIRVSENCYTIEVIFITSIFLPLPQSQFLPSTRVR
jgi:hypothetical protein